MAEPFKKGFFEFIAAADAEKVHSQTIGWIFSKDCDVFDDNEKNLILKELVFGDSKKEIDLTPSVVSVEINDIDILITCGDRLVVIENKIKSSQHSNQLYKYEYITSPNLLTALNLYKKWKSIEFPDENFESEYLKSNIKLRKELILNWEKKQDIKIKDIIHQEEELKYRNHRCEYVYLTLVKEKPESSIWKNITYSDLYNILTKYIKPDKSDKDSLIAIEYLNSINNLTSALDYMVNIEKVRKWVFEHADYTKQNVYEDENFNNYDPEIKYIASTGLVRFMQKYYYTRFCDIFGDVNSIITWNGINLKCTVGSSASNGSGLAQIYFQDSIFEFETHKFIFGYQISGNTIKFNCAAIDYQNSNYNQLPHGIEEKFKDTLENLKDSPFCFSKLQRKVNDSAKEKGKAYISLTKNFNKRTKKLIEKTPLELFKFVEDELLTLHDYAIKIKKSYE